MIYKKSKIVNRKRCKGCQSKFFVLNYWLNRNHLKERIHKDVFN